MAEYIEKETLMKRLNDFNEWCKDGRLQGTVFAIDVIKDIPAADVQPVEHGCWEEVTDYGGWGDTHYRCSVCGEEWYLEDGKPKDNNMNFCPRCGAKMDGET